MMSKVKNIKDPTNYLQSFACSKHVKHSKEPNDSSFI